MALLYLTHNTLSSFIFQTPLLTLSWEWPVFVSRNLNCQWEKIKPILTFNCPLSSDIWSLVLFIVIVFAIPPCCKCEITFSITRPVDDLHSLFAHMTISLPSRDKWLFCCISKEQIRIELGAITILFLNPINCDGKLYCIGALSKPWPNAKNLPFS